MAGEKDIPEGICACGCNQPTKRILFTNRPRGLVGGTYYKFKKGHARRGLPTNSYRAVRRPDGEIGYFHRMRAEAALGHSLPQRARIHHPDEDPWNPDARLVICPDDAYHMLLHVRMRVKAAGGNPNTDKICCTCKTVQPTRNFNHDYGRYDGFQGECRQCCRFRMQRKRAQQCLGVVKKR